jgi:hypothetical protein
VPSVHPDGGKKSVERGERRIARRFVLAALPSWVICASPRAEQTGPGSLADAIGLFGREKSAAEQYGVILITIAKDKPGLYVRGFRLYADAKAEFDGLLAELRYDLESSQDPAKSTKFNDALAESAKKRIAFTSFVSGEIDKLPGARPGLPDVIGAVPQLVKAITDAGLSIWKAFRDAQKESRDAILNELDHLQWRPFSQLARL